MPVPGEMPDTSSVGKNSPQPGSMHEVLSRMQESLSAIESQAFRICKPDGRQDKSVPGSIGLAITGIEISGAQELSINPASAKDADDQPPPRGPLSRLSFGLLPPLLPGALLAPRPADCHPIATGLMPCGPAYISGQLDIGDEIVSIDGNEASPQPLPSTPSPWHTISPLHLNASDHRRPP